MRMDITSHSSPSDSLSLSNVSYLTSLDTNLIAIVLAHVIHETVDGLYETVNGLNETVNGLNETVNGLYL